MSSRKAKHVFNMNVLPGEKTDGSGRICIHLFVQDPKGPMVEPHVLHHATNDDGEPIRGQLVAKPTRGRLACKPNWTPSKEKRHVRVVNVTVRTDDPRAVTCPKCMASEPYNTLMKMIEGGG